MRLSFAGDSLNVGTAATDVGDFTELISEINPNQEVDGYPQEWTMISATVSGLTGPTEGRFAFRYFVTGLDIDSDYIGIDEFMHLPKGGSCMLGDVNQDGIVDLLDVSAFVAAITGAFVCEADVNQDDIVDLLDVAPFVDILTGG